MIIYFYVQSGNWNGVNMTAAALKAAQLEMGTGDWHTHKATMVASKKSPENLIDYNWAMDHWYNMHTNEILWRGEKEESNWDVI